jgi:hypothetical protein
MHTTNFLFSVSLSELITMKWPEGTYHYERCAVCGRRIRILYNDDDFPVPTNQRYENYILKAGPVTALQAGHICNRCLKKPISERLVVKPSLTLKNIEQLTTRFHEWLRSNGLEESYWAFKYLEHVEKESLRHNPRKLATVHHEHS